MLNPRVNSFFSVFSQSVQEEIMAFCRRLTSTHADIYIFMARKAAAFCDCLEELGLIHLDGYVTTDRSLDISGEWLKGKNIVIVDDAVVSGTTLYTTIQKLKENDVENISIHILTINEKWYNPVLLEDDNGNSYVFPVYNNLPDNLCIKLCNDIVQAISLVPRPYDVDFPLYRTFRISEYEFSRILVLNNWDAYDIRTELQKQHDIINITLIPNKYELQNLSRIIGIDITNNSIMKIRIYGRVSNRAKRVLSLRISPFFIFEEMDIDTTQKLFDLVVSHHQGVDPSQFSDWSSTTQLRLLQFYYSHQLASFWQYRIHHLLSNPVPLFFSYRNLSFLFPDKYISAIETLCCTLLKIPTGIHIPTNQVLRNHSPETIYHATDPISLNARLYEPFIDMYHNKELPCRTLVLEKGKQVFIDPQYQSLRNRLNEGLSFQDLLERLRDCSNDYNINAKVSLFIDSSIDAGIIVPIVQQIGSTVFRAYRHGEDVLFGRREELMYVQMLSLFSEHCGSSNGISKLSAEKLIVLFSKIGLREKILYPYTSNFVSEPLDQHGRPLKILRVKPYLKGPVALLGTALQHQRFKNVPFVTAERKGLWLTNVLIQNRCLDPNEDNYKYRVDDSSVRNDLSLLTEQELSFVQDFAELAGRVSNPSEDTGITFTDNDWSKVSITLTLPDTITAVAAEMEIFYNDFDISALHALSGNEERDQNAVRFFASSFAFESIHNAVMKVESFSKKRGQELVKSVKFNSRIEQRLWLSYFSEELTNNSDNNNEQLSAIFYEQKVWVYLFEAIINAIFVVSVKRFDSAYSSHATTTDKLSRAEFRMNQAISTLKALRTHIPTNARDAYKMFDVFDSLSSDFLSDICVLPHSVILERINNTIRELEMITNHIKEAICDVLGEKGKINDILLYTSAFHINLDSCPEDMQEEAYAIIESAYRKELRKINSNRQYSISKGKPVPSIRINELPQNCKPKPHGEDKSPGIWYIGHGTRIDQQITSFAMNVFYKLFLNGIDCQVTIFDSLKYDICITSSSSEYAEYHCNQFNTFIELFKDDVLFNPSKKGPRLIHITPSHMLDVSHTYDKLRKTTSYQMKSCTEKDDFNISKSKYTITSYICTEERRHPMHSDQSIDFGIITILSEELSSIINIFSLQKIPAKFGERIYYSGNIVSAESGDTRSVLCTQTINQGELSVAHAYSDMVAKYHPKIVFLVGIAGGVLNSGTKKKKQTDSRPEQDLCDVVIAKSVIDYELRKETSGGVEHRGQVFNVDARIATVINDYLTMLHSDAAVAVEGSKNDTINVLFDAIGSGNAVIANELSSITAWLKTVNSKVAAVEMEATGISSSFYETALTNNEVQGLIIVRGISDLANTDKALCKKYRIPAAKNAAIISKQIMELFPSF